MLQSFGRHTCCTVRGPSQSEVLTVESEACILFDCGSWGASPPCSSNVLLTELQEHTITHCVSPFSSHNPWSEKWIDLEQRSEHWIEWKDSSSSHSHSRQSGLLRNGLLYWWWWIYLPDVAMSLVLLLWLHVFVLLFYYRLYQCVCIFVVFQLDNIYV